MPLWQPGNTMRERARETAALMRAELETGLGRVAVSLRQARMVGILSVVASCITLLAVAVAVATVIWALMH
jgi:hypothetical protein